MTTSDRGSPPQAGVGVTGRATLADVARLAGVSTKTVSRALSGAANVEPATRQRVEKAAATLRFRPNLLARELRAGSVSTTVGFVIGDLTNPFYMLVAAGVERVLARQGHTLVIAATEDDPAQEVSVVSAMLQRRIRALLLVPIAGDQAYLEGERQFGTPIVAVDRPLANAVSDSVVFDNREGARAGVAALLAAGHRRIAFVGSSESLYTHRERLQGYRQALAGAAVALDPCLVRTDAPDVASAARATHELLAAAEPPTAVFAGNNRATIGVLEARRSSGAPLGILGFDDFDLAATLGLSVVAHDPERMGAVATELALRRAAEPMGVVEQVVLPTRVVLRGSERAGQPVG